MINGFLNSGRQLILFFKDEGQITVRGKYVMTIVQQVIMKHK
jgi:hypothetical protein